MACFHDILCGDGGVGVAVGQGRKTFGKLIGCRNAQRDTMSIMRPCSQFRFRVVVASLAVVLLSLTAGAQQKDSSRSRKFKAPPPTSRIEVTVLRDTDGKPIENAAVIFHGVHDKSNMELKTNEDGRAVIDVLPIGEPVRLQIFAKGFQTFGDDYEVDKPQFSIGIRMKRPGEQYSIYKNHPETLRGGKSPDAAKPDAAKPDPDKPDLDKPDSSKPADPDADKKAPTPASKDEPAAQPDQQSSPSQSQPK
jgi:hypothetical protein